MARGPAAAQPRFLRGRDALVWSRAYSAEDPGRVDCAALQAALAKIPGARRMVVGHTIQASARGGARPARGRHQGSVGVRPVQAWPAPAGPS